MILVLRSHELLSGRIPVIKAAYAIRCMPLSSFPLEMLPRLLFFGDVQKKNCSEPTLARFIYSKKTLKLKFSI